MQLIEFRADDLAPVVNAMADAQWVNVQPDSDAPPQSSGFFSAFSGAGPSVPFGTWHRAEHSIGLQHGTGPKLARRVDIPRGWAVLQDHPRRGLVLRVPADTSDAEALAWLVARATELCTVELSGRWVAEVHP